MRGNESKTTVVTNLRIQLWCDDSNMAGWFLCLDGEFLSLPETGSWIKEWIWVPGLRLSGGTLQQASEHQAADISTTSAAVLHRKRLVIAALPPHRSKEEMSQDLDFVSASCRKTLCRHVRLSSTSKCQFSLAVRACYRVKKACVAK